MNLLEIKRIAEIKAIPLKKVANDVGMHENTLYHCFRQNNMKCVDLEKISAYLEVDPSVFFDYHPTTKTADNDLTNNNLSTEGKKLLNKHDASLLVAKLTEMRMKSDRLEREKEQQEIVIKGLIKENGILEGENRILKKLKGINNP